jgi:hypothetical protein
MARASFGGGPPETLQGMDPVDKACAEKIRYTLSH